jgi:uncharacterized membrane protein
MTPETPIHTGTDFVEPTCATTNGRSFQLADIAVLGSTVLAASGHLTIKAGLNGTISAFGHANSLERLAIYFRQPLVILGLFIYALGTAMWVFAVSKRDISYIFPIAALNYVVVTLGGVILFAEEISPKRWLGVAVVVLGVALMQTTGRKVSR